VPFFDGGTQRLPRIIGLSNALWLMQTGIRIGVQRAPGLGFVQEVVPTGRAVERAVELARSMAGYPQASTRSDRDAILDSYGRSVKKGLALEDEGRRRSRCSNGCRRSHAASGRPHPARDDPRPKHLCPHGIVA
jgi:enoyl-CoA hydratase